MASQAEEDARIPLWLDVDTGHDDAYALLLAAHNSKTQLLGVSTVHGNASLEQTTFNTRGILEAIGCRHIKVHAGAAKPISREAVHAADIHGESGLDGVTLLPQPIEPAVQGEDFLKAMYSALMATPSNTAYLVSTGTLTNIGLVFKKYPDLVGHLKGLSIMGGAIGGNFSDAPMGKVKGEGERFGNWTAYAEFNIYCDPEAAECIFSNPTLAAKTTLIPLDLTHQVLCTTQVRRDLLYSGKAPTSLRALFSQIIAFFAQTYADVFDLTAGPPLHDPLAVAAVIEPSVFDDHSGERFRVEIVTEGKHSVIQHDVGELGRTKATKLLKREAGVRIPRALDVERFWGMIEDALVSADKVSPMPKIELEEMSRLGILDGLE